MAVKEKLPETDVDRVIREVVTGSEYYGNNQRIILVRNRRLSQGVAGCLNRNLVTAHHLHTGIDFAYREAIEEKFSRGEFRVLVVPGSFVKYMPPFGGIERQRIVFPRAHTAKKA